LFTAHLGSGSSPLSCGAFLLLPLLQVFLLLITGCSASPASHHVCLQLMWEVGLLPSPVEFSSLHHSHKLSRSWLLGVLLAPDGASLAYPACLFTVLGRILFPQSSVLSAPTLFPPCLYCSDGLLHSFTFFPWWELACPGVYAALAQGCLWKYHVPLSSPCPHLPKPSDWQPRDPHGFFI
jgi:hypothetical protein